jgi:hypothetical protein
VPVTVVVPEPLGVRVPEVEAVELSESVPDPLGVPLALGLGAQRVLVPAR